MDNNDKNSADNLMEAVYDNDIDAIELFINASWLSAYILYAMKEQKRSGFSVHSS